MMLIFNKLSSRSVAFQQPLIVAGRQIFSPTQHVLHLLDNHSPKITQRAKQNLHSEHCCKHLDQALMLLLVSILRV